jgi:predicted GNAT family acetyltransferase
MVKWAGNIFLNHNIGLSAIHTPGDYLLLSDGKMDCVERVVKYGKSKSWKLKGVTGPNLQAKEFAFLWERAKYKNLSNGCKDFIIFDSAHTELYKEVSKNLSLQKASSFEWPRIRLWASQFAHESRPQLNINASIVMAKSMLNQNNLYLLKKSGKTVGMGGFGRSTPKNLVINMIFVPEEDRRKGYGSALVSNLIHYARNNEFSECLMFSDYLRGNNLYQSLGCKEAGRFCEIKFNE